MPKYFFQSPPVGLENYTCRWEPTSNWSSTSAMNRRHVSHIIEVCKMFQRNSCLPGSHVSRGGLLLLLLLFMNPKAEHQVQQWLQSVGAQPADIFFFLKSSTLIIIIIIIIITTATTHLIKYLEKIKNVWLFHLRITIVINC